MITSEVIQSSSSERPTRPEDLRIEDTTFYRNSLHTRNYAKLRESKVKEMGLSQDEWRTLLVLHKKGPLASIRMSKIMHMDRAAVSKAVRQLERAGLVTRVTDKKDGRVAHVFLTEQGSPVAQEVAHFMMSTEISLMEALSDEEYLAWMRITEKLKQRMDVLIAQKREEQE